VYSYTCEVALWFLRDDTHEQEGIRTYTEGLWEEVMKTNKIIIALVAIVALLFCLMATACGGGDENADSDVATEPAYVGKYLVTKALMDGIEVGENMLALGGLDEAYIELKKDNTYVLVLEDTYEGTYEVNGDKLTFSDSTASATIDGDTIVIEVGENKVWFLKEGSESAVIEDSEQESSQTEESETASDDSQTSSTGEAKWEETYAREEVVTNSLGDNYLHVLYEITNTGDVPLNLAAGDYGLSGGSCDVYDSNGDLIAVDGFLYGWDKIVQPGEKGYIYSTGIELNSNFDGKEFTVDKRLGIEEATEEPYVYALEKLTYAKSNSYGIMDVTGLLINDTSETIDQYDGKISYVIYGKDDLPINIGGISYLDRDVEAGSQIPFEISISDWTTLFGQEVDYSWAKDHIDVWAAF
jgi:hypothetical protein